MNYDASYSERIKANVDVLLLLVAFIALAYIARGYGEAGLFPLVFLVAGSVCLAVELASHFLPGGYRATVREILTREVGQVDLSTEEDQPGDSESRSTYKSLLIIALLGLFFVVTYLVNFFTATIVFTLVTGYLFGLRDYRLVLLTLLLAGIVYGVFGEVINTPIFE